MKLKSIVYMTHPVKEIEIEFHGKEVFPVKINDYNGQNGTIDFDKEITIPANAPAGKYHLYFSVKDEMGISTTVSIEDIPITASK